MLPIGLCPKRTEGHIKPELKLLTRRPLLRYSACAKQAISQSHSISALPPILGVVFFPARAQEEYLARSSGLYACLRTNPMYAFHCARHDPLYTDYVIYSPAVPVFRADDGTLLETPYTVGMITSPAVNAAALPPERNAEIGPAMWLRILKVLAAGIAHGHDSIVLGAWGCGAFGNDGAEIAELFRQALQENFRGAYRQVLFAILDWSREKRFIGPFQPAFGG